FRGSCATPRPRPNSNPGPPRRLLVRRSQRASPPACEPMTLAEVAGPRSPSRSDTLSPATRRTLQLLWLILSRELRLTRLLFASELRELLVSRALWAMILISAPLVGFSFIQAVRRYSETSSNALKLPQLAANLSPLDGVIVPTLGAVYLLNTFLLPFVAIRLIGN